MKRHLSGRILSLLLAMALLITSVSSFSFITSAADTSSSEDHYLFAYFTGNTASDETIKFAVSDDGLNFTSVNDGNAVMTHALGSRCARDPYIFKGDDGAYYTIATDADYSDGDWWGGDKYSFVIWKSTDLVHWTDETIINVNEIMQAVNSTYYVERAWAPQVMYDSTKGKYFVYFALACDNYCTGTKMYYMYTDNLLNQSSYSTPQPLMSNNTTDTFDYTDAEGKTTTLSADSIDGDITYEDDTYYLFYKQEAAGTICIATSTSLAGTYDVSNQVVLDAGSSIGALEGCQVYKDNSGNYILIADRYSNNGCFATYNLGTSLKTFFETGAQVNSSTYKIIDITGYNTDSSSNLDDGTLSPRHGSVMKITEDQYNTLKNSTDYNSAVVTSTEGVDLSDDLIAWYLVNDTSTDLTGHGYGLSTNGTVTWTSDAYASGEGAAYFTAVNTGENNTTDTDKTGYLYTDAADDMFNNYSVTNDTGFSISFLGKPDTDNASAGRFFEFNSAGKCGSIVWGTNQTTVSYVSMWGNSQVETSCHYDWNNGRLSDSGTSNCGSWHHYTVTYQNGLTTLYEDGANVASFDIDTDSTDWGSTLMSELKTSGYLLLGAAGWSDYTYSGYIRDVRVYSRAITSDEASKLPAQYANYLGEDLQKSAGSDTVVSESKSQAGYTVNGAADGSYTQDTLEKVDEAYRDVLQNVLYTYGVGDNAPYKTDEGSYNFTRNNEKGSNETYFRAGFQFGTITYLFDGVNTMACPINILGGGGGSGKNRALYSVGIWGSYLGVKPANTDTSHNWHGTGENETSSTGYQTSTTKDVAILNDSTATPNSLMSEIANYAYFSNTLYCTRTEYTDDLTADTPYIKVSGGVTGNFYAKNNAFFNLNFADGSTSYSNGTCGIYVLNYKPMNDLLTDSYTPTKGAFANEKTEMKKLYSSVTEKSWMYTSASYSAFVEAAYNVAKFDLANSSYDYSTESGVSAVGTIIQNLVSEYKDAVEGLTLNTFTVTIDEDKATLTAGNTIGSVLTVPSVGHDSSTHKTTSWLNDNVPTAETVPQSDVAYYTVTTNASFAYNSDKDNFACTHEDCAAVVAADNYTNYKTVAAKYAAIDMAAYNDTGKGAIESAYTEFAAAKDETYTSESDVQTALDKETTALLTAINVASTTTEGYTVTVNTYTSASAYTQDRQETCTYGDTVDVTIPDNALAVEVQRTRTKTDDTGTKTTDSTYISFTPGGTYTVKVQSDTIVNIYTADSSASYVLLEDYAGRAQVVYTENLYVSVSGQTLSIGGTDYTDKVPSSAYVTFTGYKITTEEDGGTTTYDSVKDADKCTSLLLSSGAVIRAYGKVTTTPVTYNVTNGSITGVDSDNQAAADTTLTVTGGTDTAAIAIKDGNDYTVLTYGSTLTFFGFPGNAISEVNIVCLTQSQLESAGLADNLPMSYGVGYASDSNTFSMYCMMSTGFNTDAAIIERGVLVSKTVSESDSLIKGASDVATLKSSSDINSLSYMATIKTSSATTIYARSYVAYTLKYEYNDTTYKLPMVAYGDVLELSK